MEDIQTLKQGKAVIYLNQVDLKKLVQEQLSKSGIVDASTYNYVNELSKLLSDHRHEALSLALIGELKHKAHYLTDLAEKSMRMYFIHFLEDIVMGRNSRAAGDIKVRCEYCSGLASLSESKHIFKGKDHGLVYLCENYKSGCDSYVAVHKGDNLPQGTLANAGTRSARQKAHKILDVLWKEYGFARVDVYRQLANYLEVKPNDCHIGKFTEQQCESAINFTKFII
ncbi:hypothetical protein H5232_13680 [Pseudoalteromonas sp. SG41-5]|uniref:zinc-finger-containing protein n=1 Tax=Pseudoalteromonas sp. SG41-5 TaxID=2760975 RepID=UPI001602F62B|nr:zinc-finger-containing protein [Pseudoalteromonas sp. SG41-5]MBB1469487.1 hypothetical protein [Pseudoalteromonas sp. SG41-5]